MGRYDGGWGGRPSGGRGGWRGYDAPWGPRDDRGIYGEAYEGYRGGYAEPGRGYDRGGPRRGLPEPRGDGYGRDFANAPFLPPETYRRHPELDRAPGPRGDRWGRELDDTGSELEDGEILRAVLRRLFEDVWVDPERIDVEVEDGVVTLRGEVDDWMEARYAWDDAWETEGVRGVVTRLGVRPPVKEETHGDLLPQSSSGTRTEPE
jgi:hypothetical protein